MRLFDEQNKLIEKVKQANRPLSPSDSVFARVLIALALIITNFSANQVGEISTYTFYIATLLSLAGLAVSYHTRHKPWRYTKILIAILVMVVFSVFITEVLRSIGEASLASVEPPLASLFIWIQALHSLDTPARRDLLFSVAASTALLAIAAAQGITTSFFIYIIIWFVAAALALESLYTTAGNSIHRHKVHITSKSKKATDYAKFHDIQEVYTPKEKQFINKDNILYSLQSKVRYIVLAIVIAFFIVILLPPASTTPSIKLPSSILNRISLANSGSLYQGKNGSEPSKPGNVNAPIRVGGYNGFSNYLDTAIRASLSNNIVMHVRASDPGYFLSMTYDKWNGTTWSNTNTAAKLTVLNGGSPFYINSGDLSGQPLLAASDISQTATNVQTFYIEETMTNVILGTSEPSSVWFPSSKLYLNPSDSSIRTSIAITPGTIYTVVSSDTEMNGNVLIQDNYSLKQLPIILRSELANYMKLPRPYRRVKQLTLAITKHSTSVYAKVEALEEWMSKHVRYSLNIPPLLPNQDTVNQFLFHDRVGYCEQISTALAVMLRSIGIPTREAVGYVPGNFNPLTDLYDVRQNDAHAWVQVWFPKYGWQNFDPTASVPLAPPNPGLVILSYSAHALKTIFWPIGLPIILGAILASYAFMFFRRRNAPLVLRLITLTLETGKTATVDKRYDESPGEYYRRLRNNLDCVAQNKVSIPPRRLTNRSHTRTNMIEYTINSYLYADRDLDTTSKLEIKKEIKQLNKIRKRLKYKKYFNKNLIVAQKT